MNQPVIEYMSLEGTPFEMGFEFGETYSSQIKELAGVRLKLWVENRAGLTREEALSIAEDCLEIQAAWNQEIDREFRGIAAGAGIDPALLFVGNGYTDLCDMGHDTLEGGIMGCTSFALEAPATQNGESLVGQTWDMHAEAEEYLVLVHRQPQEGPETLSLTTLGCLSLAGINSWGLAAGNNNLSPVDARPGVMYLALIHSALSSGRYEDARRVFLEAPRASGHHYYLAGGGDSAVTGIETTALESFEFVAEDGIYVHANHYRADSLQDLAQKAPSENSIARESRLRTLLGMRAGELDVEYLKGALADRVGDPDCICRHGKKVKTCAACIMVPAEKKLWAVAGPPDLGQWQEFALR